MKILVKGCSITGSELGEVQPAGQWKHQCTGLWSGLRQHYVFWKSLWFLLKVAQHVFCDWNLVSNPNRRVS